MADQSIPDATLLGGERSGIALMLLAAVAATGAQVLFKLSASSGPRGLWIACGVLVYTIAFFLTLMAYRVGRVSVLYSISATTFVMGALSGLWLFDEVVEPSQWFGLGLILLGVAVLGSDQTKTDTDMVDAGALRAEETEP